MSAAEHKHVLTVEALRFTHVGRKVKKAWLDNDVPQCGYCQTGQIMSAVALLAKTPHPTDAQIDRAMKGNLCRGGTYNRIRRAIHRAANAQGATQ